MIIDAKINLQINGISSFWNKRYKVYLNDNFVGNLDYKNSKIGIWSKVGTQKLIVKRKDFEKELQVNLTSNQNIITINIDENVNYSSQLLKGIVIGIFIGFFAIMLHSFFFNKTKLNIALIIPFFLFIGLAFSKSKENLPFDLKVKNA
jgi:F0F1-type ATP synthase assembly protein I